MRTNAARALQALLFMTSVCAALVACDDKDTAKSSSTAPTASASAAVPAPAPTPSGPTKPQLAVDDTAVFVSGERFDMNAPDPKGRIAAALDGKLVAGETLVLNGARDAKLAKVIAVFAAATSKKAKALEVHTSRRDRVDSNLVFVLDAKPEGCAAVGYIAKDSAISTWPASGATAERFTHGMAGPDMTRGSEGIRKRVLGCDAPAWFVSADDTVTWGLVFDLALAVMHPDDAGLPKARSLALLTKTPTAGRKVDAD